MQVHCPSCGELLRAEDMNLEHLVGRCRKCHALVNLRDYLPPSEPQGSADHSQHITDAIPEKIAVEDTGSQVCFRWRWYSSSIWMQKKTRFWVFFCIAWDSFLVFWYSLAVVNPGMPWLFFPGMPWLFFVSTIPHVAVGVGLTYYTLALLFNSTVVIVDHETVRIRHGPIPWPGNVTLPVEEITRLHVQSKPGNLYMPAESYTIVAIGRPIPRRVSVVATLKNGRMKRLLVLDDEDIAWYLKHQIEKLLGIGE